jgi:hypothetical protein
VNLSDLAEDYLVDPKKGMRMLTGDLLNEVMQNPGSMMRTHQQEKSAAQWNKTALA